MFTSKYYKKIRQRHLAHPLNYLNKSQFWSHHKLRELQFQKLHMLLEHAYLNVPYYRNLFKEIGAKPEDIRDFNDFKLIPIITKDIIRKNFEDLMALNLSKDEFLPNSTGGSDGEPLNFYQDRQFENWAAAARIRGWYNIAGCEDGDSCAVLWGAMRDVKEDYSLIERVQIFFRDGLIPINAFNLSNERMLLFLKYCQLLRPKLLRGYVTAIRELAAFIEEYKLNFPPLKGVILCAETVDPDVQVYIERILNAPAYNTYGGRELSLIAMECSERNLHEVSENNYIEFEKIDLTGYQEAGNIIVTNLNNYAMPFIRYRIGDIGIPGSVDCCNCGRGLPVIDKIIGRTTEVFVFYDGTKSVGEMFIHLMKDFDIKEYQFVQVSDAKVVLRIKTEDYINEPLKKKIQFTYKKFLPENVKLEFERVDAFNKTVTGKFRFVYRNCPS